MTVALTFKTASSNSFLSGIIRSLELKKSQRLSKSMHLTPKMPLAIVILCLLAWIPAFTQTTDSHFQDGDRFEYDLYWSFIKVGKAELSFESTPFGQSPTEHLLATFTVNTSGIADKLFKVRDRIESWIDPSTGLPSFYKKKQREGKTKRDIEISFDWANLAATYTRNGETELPLEIIEKTYDPLSLLTAIAKHDFATAPEFNQATTDGKKLFQIQAAREKTKTIKVKAGTFTAHEVDVATKELEGVFEKSPDASIQLWLSQDTPAIPLKMKSEVAVGSFYGELRKGIFQGNPIE